MKVFILFLELLDVLDHLVTRYSCDQMLLPWYFGIRVQLVLVKLRKSKKKVRVKVNDSEIIR
jgi:hypothetical protein